MTAREKRAPRPKLPNQLREALAWRGIKCPTCMFAYGWGHAECCDYGCRIARAARRVNLLPPMMRIIPVVPPQGGGPGEAVSAQKRRRSKRTRVLRSVLVNDGGAWPYWTWEEVPVRPRASRKKAKGAKKA